MAELVVAIRRALDKGNGDDALALSRELVRLRPGNPYAQRLLGQAYEAKGLLEPARSAFDEEARLLRLRDESIVGSK